MSEGSRLLTWLKDQPLMCQGTWFGRAAQLAGLCGAGLSSQMPIFRWGCLLLSCELTVVECSSPPEGLSCHEPQGLRSVPIPVLPGGVLASSRCSAVLSAACSAYNVAAGGEAFAKRQGRGGLLPRFAEPESHPSDFFSNKTCHAHPDRKAVRSIKMAAS